MVKKVIKIRFFMITFIIFSSILVFICYHYYNKSKEIYKGEKVDFECSSLKLMDGLFYEDENKNIILVSGTEVTDYDNNSSIVFMFDVTNNKLITKKELKDTISMVAFCETEDSVYFGTISTKKSVLYRLYKNTNEIVVCGSFNNKRIYSLSYIKERNIIVIATSNMPAVYSYDIISGETKIIKENFTNAKFIRSMVCYNDYCYLGLGTNADLIKMNILNGEYSSILPELYKKETFIYDQDIIDNKIYLLLSPSCKILEYNLENGNFNELEFIYKNEEKILEFKYNYKNFELRGNTFMQEDGKIIDQIQLGSQVTYIDNKNNIYGLDSSGIIKIINADKSQNVIDLYESLKDNIIIPFKYVVYNNDMFISERRFQKYNLNEKNSKYFLIKDEPQAINYDENGIYTANYTDATVYYYPYEIFKKDSYSVNMNSQEYLLCDIENQCRPYDILTSLDGKYLFVATGPLYGKFGGAISTYDLKNGALLYTDINIIENHTIADLALSSKENCIWASTTAYGENTSPERVNTSAHLFLYDYINKKIVLDIIPEKDNFRCR